MLGRSNTGSLRLTSIINRFLEVYNRVCPKVKQIVTELSRNSPLQTDSPLSSPSAHSIQPFLDELDLAKDEFNSIFEDSWHTLMSIEMQLFERTEEGNSNFENTIKEMTNEFIELSQAQFVLMREAEINFSDALVGIVQQFVTFKAASGHAKDIPTGLQEVMTIGPFIIHCDLILYLSVVHYYISEMCMHAIIRCFSLSFHNVEKKTNQLSIFIYLLPLSSPWTTKM